MSNTAFRCFEFGAIASAGLIMGMTVRPLWVVLLIIGLYIFADVMRAERMLRTNESERMKS